jgi:hypothetical protein
MAKTAAGKRRPPLRKAKTPRRGSATRRGAQLGAEFVAAVEAALKRGEPGAIPDESLRRVLTAAVKAYAAKAEGKEGELAPFEENAVTATETVVATCAMIRAADLNLFDVAMWFRRPLGEL